MTKLAFALGVALCLTHTCGPARADTTTERALRLLCGERGVQYAQHVEDAARRYMQNRIVLAAMMAKESTCRADATGARGEVGLMQIMPGRRSPAANGLTRRQLRDPRTNIHAGARWLSLRQVECGDGLRGIGGYNARTCGHGLGYARRVMALVGRVYRELGRRREPKP